MKIALCFCGQVRSFKSSYEYYKKNLLDLHDVDIYIHTWDSPVFDKNELIKFCIEASKLLNRNEKLDAVISSRVRLYGSRISFSIAIITTFSTIGLGMVIGISVGYFRGKVDAIVGRFSDFLLSFPATFMIIALSLPLVQRVEALGIAKDNGARVIVLVVFFLFFGWMGFARLIRSQAMSLRERDFVMAAQAAGASSKRIILKEMLPNLWPTAIVFISLSLPGFLSAEAVYSFLGVGIQAPASTWGLVLSDAVSYWRQDPSYLLIPSIMLVIVVLALNLLGDAIRDALDPKATH